MGFFSKGIEFNKMAKSLNGLYLMIDEIRQKKDFEDVTSDLFLASYLMKIEVFNRMDIYKWTLKTPIYAPMIPGVSKNLEYALHQTFGRIMEIGNELGYQEEIDEIFSEGELFTEIQNNIPNNVKNLLK